MVALLWTGDGASGVEGARPNIVVIYTDDQDAGSLEFMPSVQQQLVARGTSFANSFVTTPLCCPSRASFLTGRYAHNHGVRTNLPPRGGWQKFRPRARRSLSVWLNRVGYRTAWIGKYLNGYQKTRRVIPPGWDRWFGQIGARLFDYTLNQDGRIVHYGSEASDYQTDVYSRIANRIALRFAERRDPFLMVVSTGALHTEHGVELPATGNPRPAPRHVGARSDAELPDKPSFNEADVSDKPPHVARLPLLAPAAINTIEGRYRTRLESLLAVDELVASLVETLEASGELDNTVIVFTSDNGYFFGEHRIPIDKRQVYEESIRVPLVIRGPGVSEDATSDAIAANIDLAPTFLALAEAERPRRRKLDGRSLLPQIDVGSDAKDRPLLVEYFRSREAHNAASYRAVRTERYLFARYANGFRELYDLAEDPFQLDNVASAPAYRTLRRSLSSDLRQLTDCAGRSCRRVGAG